MNDIFENYKSPITVYSDFENQILQEQENQIMCKIRTFVDVDKDELIKMVNYDRNQYKEGYKAGIQKMRRHGHWVKTDWGDYKCSECGHYEETIYAGKNKIYNDFSDFQSCNNFCRNCGAFMDEVAANDG